MSEEIKKETQDLVLALDKLEQVSGGSTGANDMKTCPVCGGSVAAADFVKHIRSHPEFASNLEEILKAIQQINQQSRETEKGIVES